MSFKTASVHDIWILIVLCKIVALSDEVSKKNIEKFSKTIFRYRNPNFEDYVVFATLPGGFLVASDHRVPNELRVVRT